MWGKVNIVHSQRFNYTLKYCCIIWQNKTTAVIDNQTQYTKVFYSNDCFFSSFKQHFISFYRTCLLLFYDFHHMPAISIDHLKEK